MHFILNDSKLRVWVGACANDACIYLYHQCAQAADKDYLDSIFTDDAGRDCLWYAKNVKKTPYICSSIQAKTLCPMTCGGKV